MVNRSSKSWIGMWMLAGGLGLGFGCGDPSDPGGTDSGPPACVGGQFCVGGLECVNGYCVDPAETGDEDPSGDGDPPGDGDGDPPGDGDGDPPGDGDGDPPGDGDGDPPGDGDGDLGPDFPADGSCDLWLQNCPPGQKCAPYANVGVQWNDSHCVPISGDAEIGESCDYLDVADGVDTCAAGHKCWFFDNQYQNGTCVSLCEGTPNNPSCPGDTNCLSYNEESYFLCIPDCDPFIQDCPQGDGCYPWSGLHQCFGGPGSLQDGAVCQYVDSCAPGLGCWSKNGLPDCGGDYCCTPLCDVADPSCVAPEECIPYYDAGEAPAGLENVGYCLVP